MALEVSDRIRALTTQFDLMLTRVSYDLTHQLRRISAATRFDRRFDMGEDANAAACFDVIGDRLAVRGVELVAVEMGIVAKSAHGSLANAGAAV